MMLNGPDEPAGREDRLNRVLADFLDDLGRGEPVDLPAWQARHPAFAAELAELVAARREVGAMLPAETPNGGAAGTESVCSPLPLGALGDYELLEELGHGGMGVVYKARQRGLGRLVALKVIRGGAAATAEDRLRFRTEAEAAARLDHPNIVPVYEVGEHAGQPYLAARYVEGVPLSRQLERFRDDPRTAAGVVAVLARAVHHAHQRGVLHRDLKPGNVLLEWRAGDAGPPVPHVADFGLARLLDQDSGLTRTGDLVGTPSYMAPEQASGGAAAITTATDVHGLGAILYALLTGRPPFGGPTVLETLAHVKGRDPEAPRRLNPKVPRDLETICLTCLAKDPRRRYATALALAEDLESWMGHRPIAARPTSTREHLVKWVRRHPAATAFACIGIATVVVALAASLWHVHVLGKALADSDRLRQEGLAREARLRDLLYVADMRLAKEAWDSGDLPHLAELLERQRPAEGETDRRGFEWYWLKWCLGTRAGTLHAHDGSLLCAAVSPDDRFLVTGDRHGAVKVWDLTTKDLVASLPAHTNEVQRAAFSPDGHTLATCSSDATVRLWDVATWTERARLRGHLASVLAIAFSPDGKWLASAGRGEHIALWELPQGRFARLWLAHSKVVHDLAFTPDSRRLVSAGQDRRVRVWEVAAGVQQHECNCPADLLSLALSPDGKVVAAGGYGGCVALRGADDDRGRPAADLPVLWTVRALAFAPSGSPLVAACDSGMVRVWDLALNGRDARLSKTLQRGGGKVRAAVFARRGALLVTASEDNGTVEFWDPARLAGCETISSLPPQLSNVALSSDGRAIANHDGSVYLVDLMNRQTGKAIAPLPGAGADAVSADGRLVAPVCADGQVPVWDVASGRKVVTLNHGAPVRAVAFSPTEALVATAGDDATRLWELPAGTLRTTCPTEGSHSRCVAFAPDGRTVGVGGSGHRVSVVLWDAATGERQGLLADSGSEPTPGHAPPAAPPVGEHALQTLPVVFSPNGKTLAAAGSDGVIRLWDVPSGKVRFTFSGHVEGVTRLAFAPDGRTLASLGNDHALKFWHPDTGQPLFTMDARGHQLRGLAFSRDGRMLIAGGPAPGNDATSSLLLWRAEDQ
jgi:WD40 repeat protein